MSNKVGLVIDEIKFWRTEWEGKFLSSFCLPLMLASEFGDVSDSINSPCNITQFPVCVFPSSPWECKLRKSRNFASFTAVFPTPRTVPGLQWVFVDKWTNVYSQKGTFPICFFFFGHTYGIGKFPGQGLNLHHSSDNAGPLTHWATRELPVCSIS